MSSIKMRLKLIDGVTRIRTLITHPMETGRRKDAATGEPIPVHFIQEVMVEHNGKKIAACMLGAGMSEDPYLSFKFRGGQVGDIVRISWVDNLGQHDSAQASIKQ